MNFIFNSYKNAQIFEVLLKDTGNALENTSLVLSEYLVFSSPRAKRRLVLAAGHDSPYLKKLENFAADYPLITQLIQKHQDFYINLKLLFNRMSPKESDPVSGKNRKLIVKEIGSQLFLFSNEISGYVTEDYKLREQYKTLFEKTNDAIFIIEKSTGCYLDASAAAAQLTGRTLEELKRMTTRDVAPEGAEERLLAIAESDQTREHGTITYHQPDDTCRIAVLSTVPLDDNSVIGIARDITHDLEVEKQLRQSQKMEAMGTLAGGIVHDFNNILSGIFGYAQLAGMDLDDSIKIKKNLSQIVKGARRAAELVQQILTFSRQAESKKNPLELFFIVPAIMSNLK